MIEFRNVGVTLSSGVKRFEVLTDFSALLPTAERLVVLGAEGVGKTTLVRLISGLLLPERGKIIRNSRVSFPVGSAAALKRKVSVVENVRHVARLYGTDAHEAADFVKAATGFKAEMQQPVEDLQPQARMRLAYAIGYGIAFDTYLFDDRISAGDGEFRTMCEECFEARMKTSGCIIFTRVARLAHRFASRVAILRRNEFTLYDNVEDALLRFRHEEASSGAVSGSE